MSQFLCLVFILEWRLTAHYAQTCKAGPGPLWPSAGRTVADGASNPRRAGAWGWVALEAHGVTLSVTWAVRYAEQHRGSTFPCTGVGSFRQPSQVSRCRAAHCRSQKKQGATSSARDDAILPNHRARGHVVACRGHAEVRRGDGPTRGRAHPRWRVRRQQWACPTRMRS